MSLGPTVGASVLLGLETAGVVAVAVRVARRVADSDLLDQLAVGLLVAISQVVGVPLLLGCVDLLGRWPVAVAQLAVTVSVLIMVKPAPRGAPRQWTFRRETIGAVAACALVGTVWFHESLRGGIPDEPDTREYHITAVADWFQRHNLWHLPYAMPGWFSATFPGNAEMAALWALLPSGRDQLVYTTPLLFVAFAIVAVALLSREIGGSPAAGAIVALAAVTCPILWQGSVWTLQTDVPAAAALVMALALLMRYQRTPAAKWILLAGISLGLAVGTKYTVAVPATVMVILALVAVRKRMHLLWALPGLVVFAGPWLIRNTVITGNPIFAQSVTLGGATILAGGISPYNLVSTSLMSHILHGHGTIVRRWVDLANTWYGPVAYLSVFGLAAGWVRRRQPGVIPVSVFGVACAIGFLISPYSGGANGGVAFWFISGMRFMLPTFLVSAALLAVALPSLVTIAAGAAALLWNLWWVTTRLLRVSVRPHDVILMLGVVVAVAVAVGINALPTLTAPDKARRSLTQVERVGAAAVGVLAAIAGFGGAIHYYDSKTPPEPLALLLNRDLGPYQRVAVLSEANDRVILGAGLHRRLVLLSPGGRAHEEVFGQPDAVLIHYMNTDRVVPGLTNPPDPQASAALNAALIKSGVQAAVTGGGFVNPPPDWRPPAGWCTAGTAQTATLYLDRATARPGACPAA